MTFQLSHLIAIPQRYSPLKAISANQSLFLTLFKDNLLLRQPIGLSWLSDIHDPLAQEGTIMTIEMERTARHLRSKALQEGSEERMRALQALSYGYGTGSHANLARMLLATLGGNTPSDIQLKQPDLDSINLAAIRTVGKVAQAMQASANDGFYDSTEASSAG